MLQQHRIIYPDGSAETISHYGIFTHSSGGFAFYKKEYDPSNPTQELPYIFISGSNVRKIIPLGAV